MPLLAAHARSFRHHARLAVTLSWVAGYVNVTVVAVCGTTVSHVTGNITTFGLHLSQWFGGHASLPTVLFLLHLPLGFLIGAMLAQLLLRIGGTMRSVRPAALPMTAEVLLLAGLALALRQFEARPASAAWLWIVTSLGVVAMGLQNATITHISGSIIRTTHLTGLTTDFGITAVDLLLWAGGRLKSRAKRRWRRTLWLAARRREVWRMVLFAAVFGSFFLGAILGAIVVERRPGIAVWPPALFLLGMLIFDAILIARRRSAISAKRGRPRP